MPRPDLSDYVEVKDRIAAFYEKFPEGSLQGEVVELAPDRVTVKGIAYRTPDDPRPGIGHSYLAIPGNTPYTKGSEIENAETSAWGRAIAALGFKISRSVASADEIAAKSGSGDTLHVAPPPQRAPTAPQKPAVAPTATSDTTTTPSATGLSVAQQAKYRALLREAIPGVTAEQARLFAYSTTGHYTTKDFSPADFDKVLGILSDPKGAGASYLEHVIGAVAGEKVAA